MFTDSDVPHRTIPWVALGPSLDVQVVLAGAVFRHALHDFGPGRRVGVRSDKDPEVLAYDLKNIVRFFVA